MASEKTKQKSDELRKSVTDKILNLMEKEGLQWVQGFDPVALLAQNPCTPTRYKGSNRFLLGGLQESQGMTDPRWCTLKQANAQGWRVKKGSTASWVICWKRKAVVEDDDPNNPYRTRFLKRAEEEALLASDPDAVHYIMVLAGCSAVFNYADLENKDGEEIPPYFPPQTGDMNSLIDKIITSSRCAVVEQLNSINMCAYYAPKLDKICVPPRGAYDNLERFAATLIHEMAHSTKVPLKRKQSENKEEYAYEELLAELSSVFVCAELGLPLGCTDMESHAKYLQSWLKSCKEDPKTMERAITEAQKISDYLLDRINNVQEAKAA